MDTIEERLQKTESLIREMERKRQNNPHHLSKYSTLKRYLQYLRGK